MTSTNPSRTDEFHELLRCYGNAAYRMALHLTGGKDAEAQDLVQEAFIKVWKNWGAQRPDHFNGWMYRVMHNLYMDSLRRHRKVVASLDAQTTEGDESPWEQRLAEKGLQPQESAQQSETQRMVAEALEALDSEFRIPVALCDMEGLGYEEIAKIMSCPVGTIRSRIHRGREQLRKRLTRSLTRGGGMV